MKISVLVSIARQVEGEWIFTNIVKAHVDSNNLKEYLNTTDLPKTGVFEGVECIIEYGVFNGRDGYHACHIYLNPNYRLAKAQLECRISPNAFRYLTITLGAFTHIWERQVSQGKGLIGGTWIDF